MVPNGNKLYAKLFGKAPSVVVSIVECTFVLVTVWLTGNETAFDYRIKRTFPGFI